MHEAPFNHLDSIISRFLPCFYSSDCSIDISVSRNCQLVSSFTVPDMAVEINAMTLNNSIREVLVIGECAFSQNTDSVLWKIKCEIAAHPEVLMVMLVVIDEHQPYRSPGPMSEAWRTLRQESSISYSSFLSLRGAAAQSYDKAIVIANHTWCHLRSVRFHVWVRGDEPIDVDVDNELLARGTLFPNQDMGAVDTMIEKGMQDYITTTCDKLAPGSYISACQDSSVTFRSQWDRLLRRLTHVAGETAYHRYRT
ncbi:hypothetical protein BDR07DRAFT_1421165 [Suillus spraguei]|nr:hypothetical protein BDR07DRAFT_1421165 [Suillus spraguei]